MTDRQARYVVRKADHVGGAPIPDDEPVLVVRAQDVLAMPIMDEYIDRYRQRTRHVCRLSAHEREVRR